jgi:hypothetical protein
VSTTYLEAHRPRCEAAFAAYRGTIADGMTLDLIDCRAALAAALELSELRREALDNFTTFLIACPMSIQRDDILAFLDANPSLTESTPESGT